MNTRRLITCIALTWMAMGVCVHADDPVGPISVTIERDGDRFSLTRGGKPYTLHGVSGFSQLDAAVAAGATTLRTWGIKHLDEGRLLDAAHERGLTVLVGLWLGHKRDGFDYDDPEMVRKQFDALAQDVLRYKDHPAVLAWGVGNEAEARGAKPWAAINQLAQYIHDVDPHHPTVCIIAGSSVEKIRALKEQAPAIDILGVNSYRAYAKVRQNVRKAGWDGPYLVTEMGIDGTWEAQQTDWGAPLEPPSGVKAELYRQRYLVLAADTDRCMGVFPFMWGYVPKGTSTWFSLFHANGEPNAVVDVIHHLWRGQWPMDRAPMVESLTIDGRTMGESIHLRPGQSVIATVSYTQADAQSLDVRWELHPENKVTDKQGAQALKAALAGITFETIDSQTVRFAAPSTPGPYRLHFIARTPAGKIGTANVPFHVDEPQAR